MTKYEAERLVQAARDELPVSVFRPGMVVGDSQTGEIKTFNTLYYPLRLYLMDQLAVVPTGPSAAVNLVPVDYVARAVAKLTFDAEAAGLNFHLTAPQASLPTVAGFARVRAPVGSRAPGPGAAPIRSLCRCPCDAGNSRPVATHKPPKGRLGYAQNIGALHGRGPGVPSART